MFSSFFFPSLLLWRQLTKKNKKRKTAQEKENSLSALIKKSSFIVINKAESTHSEVTRSCCCCRALLSVFVFFSNNVRGNISLLQPTACDRLAVPLWPFCYLFVILSMHLSDIVFPAAVEGVWGGGGVQDMCAGTLYG